MDEQPASHTWACSAGSEGALLLPKGCDPPHHVLCPQQQETGSAGGTVTALAGSQVQGSLVHHQTQPYDLTSLARDELYQSGYAQELIN